MSQRPLQPTTPHPISTLGFIRGSYISHLRTWLRTQSLPWHPSMLATKLGHDIERQIILSQHHHHQQRALDDVGNLMRAVTYLHAELVHYGVSTHKDPHRVWRDVLQYANPWFLVMRPRFREMLEEEEGRGAGVVLTKDDFLEEFDRFVREEGLNGKVVVLMNCPDCERWDEQNFHRGYRID